MRSTARMAGIAGLVFTALALATFAAPPPPALGASPEAIVAYFGGHRDAALLVSALTLFALVPLLVFAACAPGDRRPAPWSGLAIAGATGIATSTLIATGANVALALGAASWLPHDHALAAAMFALQGAIWPAIGVFAAALLAAVSAAGRGAGWMPRSVAAIGAAAAALELASVPAGIFPEAKVLDALGLPGYLLVLVWMASSSVVLLRARTTVSAPAVATA